MTRVAISELEGVALDWAVAKAIGLPLIGAKLNTFDENHLSAPARYSTDWSQCGPLIERYGISLMHRIRVPGASNGYFHAQVGPEEPENDTLNTDDSPLVAACRAILAAHNPDGFVDVPEELIDA